MLPFEQSAPYRPLLCREDDTKPLPPAECPKGSSRSSLTSSELKHSKGFLMAAGVGRAGAEPNHFLLHDSLYTRTTRHFTCPLKAGGEGGGGAQSLNAFAVAPAREAGGRMGRRCGRPSFIWRGSWPVSGRWRPPRPSAASAAPRGGTVCCWVCWNWSRSRRPKPRPGEAACPAAVPTGLFQMTWWAATERVSCGRGGGGVRVTIRADSDP